MIRLHKNKRMPVDPPNDAIESRKIRDSPSAGTINEPISVEDSNEDGIIPAAPNLTSVTNAYYHNNNTAMEGIGHPEETKLAILSTKKDRIEESRDQSDYRYETPQMNRNQSDDETMRDPSTEPNSLQQHSSLEMPSLHSQFSSIESYQTGSRNQVSATMLSKDIHKVHFANSKLLGHPLLLSCHCKPIYVLISWVD